ncbi:hypothetical protein A2576_04450 [Candidatus Amesbacteria bacterium RIFOXYD1_FULL_47_9]|uniref:Glycosyltransferase RgtA/B/C/D-like domain-containing protein n=1 Tax=Candidatus Amesbacteria bacterium RIFOXYD1_FULL_47_9 TaxID=1797267 RepID=A0A1F5A2J0_9BACT|nr:MAG: hypothetical protein A2V48_03165 [Candidatus Amesbacteria bacterium RBG_19FT_COMBO_48_16]OGD02751.1 MAG: hypothetical protein A2354_03830 [Candidatus Amesbacteria bacterium RIFOXYB1_FULL_47_12]OGD07267.1 MAG: hypothetical protein A3B58_03480 [Candidatus Amesbacteria bacterium RIFCSPLOWO2_01_FULL_48_50]OGD12799.1 MAG: hypothetical protein A2576_04450 [Candidatus Amesbacteria bacterium RIFOXYD1_FULL_47_9]
MIFFGDQAWFYLSARDALLTGRLPLVGITSSIVWLHQGPLWTYLLIPVLALSGFHPVSGSILVSFFNILAAVLLYFLAKFWWGHKAGLIAAFLFVFNPMAKIYFSLAYHTSLLPLFTLIFLWCLVLRRHFLSGLFLGFLYQLHLLTFIFWPLVLFKLDFKIFLGFTIGILPFILFSPLQTFGIFVWFGKHLFSGFSGTTVLSEAYLMVFLTPAILILSRIFIRLPRIVFILTVVFLLIGYWKLNINKYGPLLSRRISLSRQILGKSSTLLPKIFIAGPGAQYSTSSYPYIYLLWWLGNPAGFNSVFQILEESQTFQVLK